VALFVSDAASCTPANGGTGRLFLQVHYARDIAQRLGTTAEEPVVARCLDRAVTPHQRTLVGLHDPAVYGS
jgi:hypothetical protein